MAHSRPMSLAGTQRRGRLRVFLGAAPGVGKTYAMLNDAHRLKAEGHDVVIGFVETHDRPETDALVSGLNFVPPLKVSYRGVTICEMDTSAILARKPEIVLIDELAHTNAPGSPRAKRYEDVALLCDAGIDVISTLNVQHLDSLQDVVAGITGVEVRETVPDRVLDVAELHLVDLPTDLLIDRLRQGKIYPPQRAQQALQHFFRPGNLTALRELALRRTAEGVEDALTAYMHENTIGENWPAAERVMVLVDGDPSAGTVLRNAWRLASALRAELVVAAAVPPGGIGALPIHERQEVERTMLTAEDLGGRTRVIETSDFVSGLTDAVREENVTVIVLRHQRQRGWQRLRGPSLIDALLNQLENVDVLLVETRRSSR